MAGGLPAVAHDPHPVPLLFEGALHHALVDGVVLGQQDAEGALSRIGSGQQWDLLITDIELPGMSGLELLERARQLMPGLPVAVMTGFPSVDYAVSAEPAP